MTTEKIMSLYPRYEQWLSNPDNAKLTYNDTHLLTPTTALGIFLMVFVFIGCALTWFFPSQISKIILPARTSYGTIDRYKEKKRELLKYIFFILSLFGWVTIYYNAFYKSLGFFPKDWGERDEYGDWASYRSGLAGTVSFWLSIFTLVQLEKMNVAYMTLNKDKDKQSKSLNNSQDAP